MTDGGDSHLEPTDRARSSSDGLGPAIAHAIEQSLGGAPVGLVLIELLVDTDIVTEPVETATFQAAVSARIAGLTGDDDTILSDDPYRLAIVKPGLTASAEAEGFAYRVQASLADPLPIGPSSTTACQAAIGVAVSRRGDRAADVVRYAEHALGDARMLGGDMVVPFDDQDRDLLLP